MDGPGESAEFEEADELQRLRRRAYGPNADIAGDAAAQARLSELEAAKRRERTPVVDAAAALPDPVSERVPVARPLEGSRPASTSVPQPVNGASPEREPDEGSVTERDPAGAPIPNSGPIDGALPAPWWRRRRSLSWVIAAVAVLSAAIGIGVFVVDESNQPTPVAHLTPQGQPANASIPAGDEVPVKYDLTVEDFVSYGSYGPLQIWSTTKLENKRCIAVVIENHISVFECTAPSVDTIADIDIDPNMIPPAPSGEPTPYIRFILHDEVVDVYRPTEKGEFYGSTDTVAPFPESGVLEAGTYLVTRYSVPFEITVPDGWETFDGTGLGKDDPDYPDTWNATVLFWDGTHVPTDACDWQGALVQLDPTAEAFVDAMTAQASAATTPPVKVAVGDYSGFEFDYAVESDVDFLDCDLGQFCVYSDWEEYCSDRMYAREGEHETYLVVDLNGERAVIAVGQSDEGLDPALTREARAIFDSIKFVGPDG